VAGSRNSKKIGTAEGVPASEKAKGGATQSPNPHEEPGAYDVYTATLVTTE
jgi:hypothetical protein